MRKAQKDTKWNGQIEIPHDIIPTQSPEFKLYTSLKKMERSRKDGAPSMNSISTWVEWSTI